MSRASTDSKERILEAACELIARKGFRDVTHKEICGLAGANPALVNYYFGSKDKLYEAVWESAFARMQEKYRAYESKLPCKEKLMAILRDLLSGVFDDSPAGWYPAILHREMTQPTELTPIFQEKYMAPMRATMLELVAEYLGPKAADMEAQCGMFGLISICAHLNIARRRRRWILESGDLNDDAKAQVVDELIAFAMGGLDQLKNKVAQRQ